MFAPRTRQSPVSSIPAPKSGKRSTDTSGPRWRKVPYDSIPPALKVIPGRNEAENERISRQSKPGFTLFTNRVKVITFAESPGGVETSITYPVRQTRGDIPVEIREKTGVTDDLLRLSVGIEHLSDLIGDLEQAMGRQEAG
jgi:hypothetical protein